MYLKFQEQPRYLKVLVCFKTMQLSYLLWALVEDDNCKILTNADYKALLGCQPKELCTGAEGWAALLETVVRPHMRIILLYCP